MKIGSAEKHAVVPHKAEAAILFNVGPYKFAISATDVEEIRHLDGLKESAQDAFKGHGNKSRMTLQRDRSSCAIVDASMHFRLLPSRPSRALVLRTGTVALTADSIDRMIDISSMVPLPVAFQGEERKWFRGLAFIGDSIVPVVSADSILSEANTIQSSDAIAQSTTGVSV